MPEITFNQYAPGGCFKQLSDAAGGDIESYNQYSPGGPSEQLRLLIDPTMVWDQYAPGGVFEQAAVELEGGGEESWIPEDAKIHIDFVGGDPQGRAWVAGTGEVAIDTLVGNDPVADNAWAETGYDPAGLDANGYTQNDLSLAFIGVASTALLAGATCSFQYEHLAGSSRRLSFLIISASAGGGVHVNSKAHTNTVDFGTWVDELVDTYQITGQLNYSAISDTLNKLAATIVDGTRYEIAVNGNVALAGILDELDRAPEELLSTAFIETPARLQSITIYDPLPSTGGLSELSEP